MKNKSIKKPILFATLGFPGSGKTFFSRRFAKEFGLFHLNSDRLRAEIFPKPEYTAEEFASVFRTMDYIAEELLRCGVSAIYDANLTKRIYRQKLQKMAKKQKAGYLLLWFKTPAATALKRIKKRGMLKSELLKRYHIPLGESVLFKIKKEEEEPPKEPYIVLEAGTYGEQRNIVKKFLRAGK